MKNIDSILIVGGAGYIGSHVNKELSKQGYKTIIFDNLGYGHREFLKWGEFFEGDLADIDKIKLVFDKYNIGAVMHFSAYTHVGESVIDPAKYYVNNVANTLNLLNVMREYDVRYFIFSSSCAVYGNTIEVPIPETHQLKPINPYGRTKLMIETILSDFSDAYKLKYVSLRYFNAAGADFDTEIGEWHNPETHLIPLVLDTALGKRDMIEIYGTDYDTPDGTCVRDYIHVLDIADAHIKALKRLEYNGDSLTLNLGNGNGYSVKKIIETAHSVTGKEIKSREGARREGDPAVLIGDATQAMKLLGWKPRYGDLKKIIETAWQWHKKLYAEYKR